MSREFEMEQARAEKMAMGSPAKGALPVFNGLERLTDANEGLHRTIGELITRLEHVSMDRSEPKPSTDELARPIMSDTANRIHGSADGIENANRRLRQLIENLEI